MHAIFDRQHYGKPKTPPDLGVGVDLDGDGERDDWEANLTLQYIEIARDELVSQGHQVTILDQGWYPTRHAQANALAKDTASVDRPVAYVACHLNASPPGSQARYGLAIHDERSRRGKDLATALGGALRGEFNPEEMSSVRIEATSTDNAWHRAYCTISGIYDGPPWISGVCFEPLFVDGHRDILANGGLGRVGKVLAAGVLAWAQSKAISAPPSPSFLHDGLPVGEPGRDPRWDPHPEDIVTSEGGRLLRRVVDVDEANVYWQDWVIGGEVRRSTIRAWRKFALDGRYLDRGTWKTA